MKKDTMILINSLIATGLFPDIKQKVTGSYVISHKADCLLTTDNRYFGNREISIVSISDIYMITLSVAGEELLYVKIDIINKVVDLRRPGLLLRIVGYEDDTIAIYLDEKLVWKKKYLLSSYLFSYNHLLWKKVYSVNDIISLIDKILA